MGYGSTFVFLVFWIMDSFFAKVESADEKQNAGYDEDDVFKYARYEYPRRENEEYGNGTFDSKW